SWSPICPRIQTAQALQELDRGAVTKIPGLWHTRRDGGSQRQRQRKAQTTVKDLARVPRPAASCTPSARSFAIWVRELFPPRGLRLFLDPPAHRRKSTSIPSN